MKGFTLIELLVVISIIAILSVIGITAFQGTQAKARDSIRKQDLRTLATALEIYYQKNNKYVENVTVCQTNPDISINTFYSAIKDYINGQTPTDPNTKQAYCYLSENGLNYTLCAKLENTSDPDIISGACNPPDYNYAKSSEGYIAQASPTPTSSTLTSTLSIIISTPTPTPLPSNFVQVNAKVISDPNQLTLQQCNYLAGGCIKNGDCNIPFGMSSGNTLDGCETTGSVINACSNANNYQSCFYSDLPHPSNTGVAGASLKVTCTNQCAPGDSEICTYTSNPVVTGADGIAIVPVYRPSASSWYPLESCTFSVVPPSGFSIPQFTACRQNAILTNTLYGFTQSPPRQITDIATPITNRYTCDLKSGPDAGTFNTEIYTNYIINSFNPAVIFVLKPQ